jgi:hypothetical protein
LIQRPYADAEIVVLQVGAKATPFSVHGHHFAKSAVLAAKYDPFSLAEQHVSLQEIDEATAHVLVHFLYTERYDDVLASSDSTHSVLDSYKLGTCVYCAAIRYELPSLAELAKEKVVSLSEEVAISDVLVIAKNEAFRLLPEHETWYPSYFEGAVRSAMAKDPEPFRRPDFITQVEGNTRLLQVVWKTVMSGFAHTPMVGEVPEEEVPENTIRKVSEVIKPELEQRDVTAPIDIQSSEMAKEDHPADIAAHDVPSEPINAEVADVRDAPIEDTLKLEEIEPTVETTEPLESFTDELGYQSSKTYHKMKDQGADTMPSPSAEDERSAHKRSDSVMQGETAVTVPLDEEVNVVDEIDDKAQGKIGGVTEGSASQKKSKKSKKKKSSIVF